MAGELITVRTKHWYESKVVWLNVVTFAVMALSLPQVTGIVPPEATTFVGALSAVLNLILRMFFTLRPTDTAARGDGE